ncbi:MAG: hypothetical protein HY231_01415 [Acidobacteria bacterium]|nr:hypothetical protein [Acidobacteriota bacterium]
MFQSKRFLYAALLFMVCASASFAQHREITFPLNGEVSSLFTQIIFTEDNQLGFAIVFGKEPTAIKLYSFSVAEGKVIDEADFASEFAPATDSFGLLIAPRLHSQKHTLAVWGQDSTKAQKIMLFSYDQSGHLQKLWAKSFPRAPFFELIDSAAAFNADASRIYYMFIDTEGQQNLALLDSSTGDTLSTMPLPADDYGMAVFFNDVRHQAVALSGTIAYVFTSTNDRLEMDYQIDSALGARGGGGQSISQNGRFLIAYGGFTRENPPNTKSIYVTYDFDKRIAQEFLFSGQFAAIGQNMAFHRATDKLLAPLPIKVKEFDESLKLILSGSRLSDILTLDAEGTIKRVSTVELPEHSDSETLANRTYPVNNTQVSASGALGLVSSGNGHVFSFDTQTGEIVNDEKFDTRMYQIYLLESRGLLAYVKGDNKLYLAEITTAPIISSVKLKKKNLTIRGANYLAGVKVKINGVEVINGERNPINPGREIVLPLGRKDLPPTQELRIEVTNRDGLISKPFVIKP